MHWIYHPAHEAKIVDSDEYDSYLANGWFDSPTKCVEKIDVPHETIVEEEKVISESEPVEEIDSEQEKTQAHNKKGKN